MFLTNRFYAAFGACSALFFAAFFLPWLFEGVALLTIIAIAAVITDLLLLYGGSGRITAERELAPRFSLGDENPVTIRIRNSYRFRASLSVIDELPVQQQERSFLRKARVGYRSSTTMEYQLRPVMRGEHFFGTLRIFARSPLGLLQRRFAGSGEALVKVYPSFLHLRKYQLMATTDVPLYGARKVRRIGHSMEFEKIKEYVQGDDVRTINWKATARRGGDLMVNTYTDARQQQIYCIIDKGRAMKMPFEGMTLLGYAINAGLALLNIALLRNDKAGLITFAEKVHDIIPAERQSKQLHVLLEALYKQQTDFKESDYQSVGLTVQRRVTTRSLLLLFTNFESMSALQRQLPYLRRMSARHLLCVVFFRNTLLRQLQEQQPDTVEGIYIKTIADRFDFEKRQMVKELRRHGILSILSTPQELSVDVINKYLELKARQMI